MSLFSGLKNRMGVAAELFRMARDRKLYFMAPLFIMLAIALFLLVVGELPVLIPFFYAVF